MQRPSVFGNPFRVDRYGLERSVQMFSDWLYGNLDVPELREARAKLVSRLHELIGRDLVCCANWDPERGERRPLCHGAILMDAAESLFLHGKN